MQQYATAHMQQHITAGLYLQICAVFGVRAFGAGNLRLQMLDQQRAMLAHQRLRKERFDLQLCHEPPTKLGATKPIRSSLEVSDAEFRAKTLKSDQV